MPPRRSHKKSKAGCQRCKLRKIKVGHLIFWNCYTTNGVKCDEIHPTCGNCSKHGVSCDFEGIPISPSTPGVSPPSLPASSTTESGNSPAASAASPRSSHSSVTPFYQTPTDLVRANTNLAASRQLELKLMVRLFPIYPPELAAELALLPPCTMLIRSIASLHCEYLPDLFGFRRGTTCMEG
jgi:hypothetical protein